MSTKFLFLTATCWSITILTMQELGTLHQQLAALAQATPAAIVPLREERKQEIAENKGSQELQAQINALIDTYMKDAAAEKNPLSSMISSNKQWLKIVIWDTVQAALQHFPDKTKLHTFTAYYSGHLAVEYLILKALELAGFTNITDINIADIEYPHRHSFKHSKEFFPDVEKLRIKEREVSQETEKRLNFFRQQFSQAGVHAYHTIYDHSFLVLDLAASMPGLKSDLIFMLNRQPSEESAIKALYEKKIKEYKEKYKNFSQESFDYISRANANNNALIVEARWTGVHCIAIPYQLPLPSDRLLSDITTLKNVALLRPEEVATTRYQQKKETVEETIRALGDSNPNKQLLLTYVKNL